MRHTDDRGGMVLAAWLFLLLWALSGIPIALLCAGTVDDMTSWAYFLQAYTVYFWVSIAMAGILVMAIGQRER